MAEALIDTHTVAALPISPEAHAEIAAILRAAGYDHVFTSCDQGVLIDMTGLALIVKHGE